MLGLADVDNRAMAARSGASETHREGGDLHVHHTIPAAANALEYWTAAAVHIAVWGGGMMVGPFLLLVAPFAPFVLPWRQALALDSAVAALLVVRLAESPWFNRVFLRTAALLKGGSTIWIADSVLPHVGEGAMVCYHPHGIIPMGFSLNGAVRAKTRQPHKFWPAEAPLDHRVSGVQAAVLFQVPILRQMMHMFGCTVPATKAGMFSLFKQKMPFGIIIGGSEEVAIQVSGRERLFLKHRAGFLKYALQFGYKICVAYNFGESDLYNNASFLRPLNMWLVKRFGFVLPVFYGRWWCPLLPRGDVELNTVFGAVLELPRIDNPTEADVAEWHGKYIRTVTEVFDRHKHRFGYGSRMLEIL